jgi:tryptophan synthase alpha chain
VVSRFASTFERLKAAGACGLFPYLTAGFPDIETNRRLAEAALAAGADGFEIGVPFSDPLADGATLQRANARALAAGASLETALDLARFIRARSPDTPVALMTYYNPVLHLGDAAFADALAGAGADGSIVPDLPVEEAESLHAALASRNLALVGMVAPTSPDSRIRCIVEMARGFIYCVALAGVTGARQDVSTNLGGFLGRIRGMTPLPLVVGFGISRPEHVRSVAALGADGLIVGSALADRVELAADPVAEARSYLAEMKAATLSAAVA